MRYQTALRPDSEKGEGEEGSARVKHIRECRGSRGGGGNPRSRAGGRFLTLFVLLRAESVVRSLTLVLEGVLWFEQYGLMVKLLIPILLLSLPLAVPAELSTPSIFSDHMVLQRDQVNSIWGKADPGESVVVSVDGWSETVVADESGDWMATLEPLPAGGPHSIVVAAGEEQMVIEDVLVGEVWICSGQSNMQWSVENSNHADVELATASNDQIRLLTIPRNGTQEPQDDFEGSWQLADADSVKNFSAVGYFFGKRLNQALDVPIGLIDNSWGGSAIEAWIPRERLEEAGDFEAFLSDWDERTAAYNDEIHEEKLREFRAWKDAGEPAPRLRYPQDPRFGQHRPGNIFSGMVDPIIGYGIRGMIWYQGETNAGRAETYRTLFPLMISTYRELWKQGDFSFYWAQLADFFDQQEEPSDHPWSYLREAQSLTCSLPNTGEAVIIDTGEGNDIHPRDKQTVAYRLLRHALAKDYGFPMASESPRFLGMEVEGDIVTVTFDHVDKGLRAFDFDEVRGFSIAGAEKKFYWAKAKIVGKDRVELRSDFVADPMAVRYAWAVNPVANLHDRNGLPVTPFRTDED